MAGFRDLEVWQLGRSLANDVYELTKSYPASEQYGLTSQLRRAAVSVPANIAEGWGRNSDGSFAQYLRIARGSLNEVETLIVISTDQGYASETDHDWLVAQIETLVRKLFNLTAKVGPQVVREDSAEYGDGTVTMFRPTGSTELALLEQSGFRAWPPRLAEQPIFYPVTNAQYAGEIAGRWNVRDSGKGFVTRFQVKREFAEKYPVQCVGASHNTEWWIPAEDLDELNDNIVGLIEVIAEFPSPSSQSSQPLPSSQPSQ